MPLEFCLQQTVKIDINIERDLAYALKIKECPQILFLRGNRILYREKRKIPLFLLFLGFGMSLPHIDLFCCFRFDLFESGLICRY